MAAGAVKDRVIPVVPASSSDSLASDRFVRFPRPLYDALLRSRMPATHLQVALVVIRETYGRFGRETAPVSLSLFAELTDRSKRGIQKALGDLEREGVLLLLSSPTNRAAAVYSLNPNPATWGRFTPAPILSADAAKKDGDDPEGREWNPSTTPETREVNQSSTLEVNGAATLEVNAGSTTIDSRSLDSPSGATGAPEDNSDSQPEASPPVPESAQVLVAHAVRYARSRGLTPPNRGHLGKQLKDLLADQAKPGLLRRAVELLIDQGATPGRLRFILGDLEREAKKESPAERASWSARKRYCMEYFQHHLFLVCDLAPEEERELKAALLSGGLTREEVERWR